jgi:hypothetical protein
VNNNIGFFIRTGGTGNAANYSLFSGNVLTQAAFRLLGLPQSGALDWGIRNEAYLASMIANIVAHANDPDNVNDRATGISGMSIQYGAHFNDTKLWEWHLGGTHTPREFNIDGLDPQVLNETTIHRYALTLPNQGVPDEPHAPWSADAIQALSEYLRSLDGAEYTQAVQDILA